jgi:hypothetical protein
VVSPKNKYTRYKKDSSLSLSLSLSGADCTTTYDFFLTATHLALFYLVSRWMLVVCLVVGWFVGCEKDVCPLCVCSVAYKDGWLDTTLQA